MYAMPTSKCVLKKLRRSKVTLWTRKQLVSVVLLVLGKRCRNWELPVWLFTVPASYLCAGYCSQRFRSSGLCFHSRKAISEALKYTGNADAATAVGKAIAERAIAKGVQNVSFDRSGFKYHGRVSLLWLPLLVTLVFSSKLGVEDG